MNPHEVQIHCWAASVLIERGTLASRLPGRWMAPIPSEELRTTVPRARAPPGRVDRSSCATPPTAPRCCSSSATPSSASWAAPGSSPAARSTREDADHAAAAVRELEEEAGIALPAGTPSRALLALDHARGRGRDDPLRHLVLRRRGARPAPRPRVDGSECVDARWLAPGRRARAARARRADARLPHDQAPRGAGGDGLGRGDARRRRARARSCRCSRGSSCATAPPRSCCRASPATTRRSAATQRAVPCSMQTDEARLLDLAVAALALCAAGAVAVAGPLIGTDGADRLQGTPEPDQLYGEGGDDALLGLGVERLPRGRPRRRRRRRRRRRSTWSSAAPATTRRRAARATTSSTRARATTSCSAARAPTRSSARPAATGCSAAPATTASTRASARTSWTPAPATTALRRRRRHHDPRRRRQRHRERRRRARSRSRAAAGTTASAPAPFADHVSGGPGADSIASGAGQRPDRGARRAAATASSCGRGQATTVTPTRSTSLIGCERRSPRTPPIG